MTLLRATASALLLLVLPAVAAAGQTNQPVPNAEAVLVLKDLEGRQQSLGELRGKLVVLNFWATWCIPCREEMPILVSLNSQYARRGVQFVAASADDASTQKAVPQFPRKLRINFPVWVGATTNDMERLGLGDALPATVIVDRDGKIAGRIIGVVDKADLKRRIEWLLGDRQSPAPAPLVNNLEKSARKHKHKQGEHAHEGEEEHEHGGVGVEGASTVPS